MSKTILRNFGKFIQFIKIQVEGSFWKISENFKKNFRKILKMVEKIFRELCTNLSSHPSKRTQLHTKWKRENKHIMIQIFTNVTKVYLKLPKRYSYMIWTNLLHCSYEWLSVHVSCTVKGFPPYFKLKYHTFAPANLCT